MVTAAVAVSVAWPPALPFAAAIGLIFWPLRRLQVGRWSRRTQVDLAAGLLLLALPVTLWASPLPEVTREQVLRLFVGLLWFYSLVNWAVYAGRLRLALWGTVLAAVGLALVALVSVEWPLAGLPEALAGVLERLSRLSGDVVNPNVMAGSLVLLLPLVLAALLYDLLGSRWWLRAGLLLLALGGTALVVLAGARGALLALIVQGCLLAALRWNRGWLVLAVALLAGVVGAMVIGLPKVLEFLSVAGAVGGIEGRVEIWSRAVYMIQDFPFTGIGMGAFTRVSDVLYPMFLYEPGRIDHAHNLFLQVAVDLGLPGLIAWLAVLLLAALTAVSVWRDGAGRGDRWAAGLGAGLLASQTALVVHGLFDAVTWGMVRPAPLVWAVWGLAMAAGNLYLRPAGEAGAPLSEPASEPDGGASPAPVEREG